MQTCAHCCIAAFTACRVSAEFGSSVVPCAGGLPPLSSVGQFGADLGRGERSVMKTSQQCNNRRHKAAREAAAKTCHNKCSRSQIPESAHLIIGLLDASIKLEILNPGWQSNLAQVSAVVLLPLHCSLTFLASQLDPPRPMLPQMNDKHPRGLFGLGFHLLQMFVGGTQMCTAQASTGMLVGHKSSGLQENKARPAFSSLMLLLWARAFNHQMCRQLFLPPVNGRRKRRSWGGPSWRLTQPLTDLSAHALSALQGMTQDTDTHSTH